MSLDTLHDLMIAELRDLYSAETQIVKALPKMAEGAKTPSLRTAFENHLGETKEHIARLEKIFGMLNVSKSGKKCKGMEGLLEEGGEMLGEKGDDTVRDAGIIASAQRVEHYEIAAYGSTHAFAMLMGHTEIADLLEMTLNEEKAADAHLTEIAQGEVNQAAPGMDEEEGESGEDEADEEDAAPGRKAAVKSGASASSKSASARNTPGKSAPSKTATRRR